MYYDMFDTVTIWNFNVIDIEHAFFFILFIVGTHYKTEFTIVHKLRSLSVDIIIWYYITMSGQKVFCPD